MNENEDKPQDDLIDVPGNETVDEGVTAASKAEVPHKGRLLPVLIELASADADNMHVLEQRDILIGRDPSQAEICLQDNRVSRKHARIVYENMGQPERPPSCVLEDLESRNGTFINNRRIEKPTALKTGDVILVGRSPLGYYLRSELEVECDRRVRGMLKKRGFQSIETGVLVEGSAVLNIVFPEETFSATPFNCKTKWISLSGARVVTTEVDRETYMKIIKTMRYIRLKTILPGSSEETVFRGKVAWVDYDGSDTPPFTVIGIEFMDMSESLTSQLKKCLQERIARAEKTAT